MDAWDLVFLMSRAPRCTRRCLQVREQAKAFLQKPEDHMQGLNLINSTNLDYFQPQHQAEMINLKAQFFAALGDSDAGVLRGTQQHSCGPRADEHRHLVALPCARGYDCSGWTFNAAHSPARHSQWHVQRGADTVAAVLGGVDGLGQVLRRHV